MLSIGALVPNSHPLADQAYIYANKLRELSKEFAKDVSKYDALEEFWKAQRLDEAVDTDSAMGVQTPESTFSLRQRRSPSRRSVMSYRRQANRSRSNSELMPTVRYRSLHPSDPSRSLIQLIEALGPLIFPVYRAALSRKRILVFAEPPVEKTCHYVSTIASLARIPNSVSDLITSSHHVPIKPLYSVGVHDIPIFEEEARHLNQTSSPSFYAAASDSNVDLGIPKGSGWIACTTDGILKSKTALYDISITFPPSYTINAKERRWPVIEKSNGEKILASQRDLRRFTTLRRNFNASNGTSDIPSASLNELNDQRGSTHICTSSEEAVCEKPSWPEVLHRCVEWCSKRVGRPNFDDGFSEHAENIKFENATEQGPAEETLYPNLEVYFHHMSSQILSTMADIIESEADEEYFDNDADEVGAPLESTRLTGASALSGSNGNGVVRFTAEDVNHMGLDEWNETDRNCVRDLARKYFGRRAEVRAPKIGISCCGLASC